MRQGQPQNRQRSRGRGNNNRNNNNRNNLNRSMESNGPDVRIRGTASHIAEKYQQLARDAQSAGDSVAAESYWQHAEHYNRLIAVAQAAQAQLREEQQARQAAEGEAGGDREDNDENNNNRGRGRGRRNNRHQDNDVSASEAGEEAENVNGSGPQPSLDEVPAEVALNDKPLVVEADAESAPVRKSRRPRRKVEVAPEPVATAETKPELPAFISGGADE